MLGHSAQTPILIVEDDVAVGALLCELALAMEYKPALVTSGEEALLVASALAPMAIVLDILLPGIDGLTTTRELRSAGVRAPIVILSVLAAPADVVAGFSAGADEYIGKPFDIDVFRLRLQSAVRRGFYAQLASPLHYGGIHLDLIARRAETAEGRLCLAPLEFELLRVLMQHAGHVVSIADLAANVWGDREVRASNAYHVAVQRLRRKLEAARCSAVIRCLRGEGYVLMPGGQG